MPHDGLIKDIRLSPREYAAFRQLLFNTTGVNLGSEKAQLVMSRLSKRLRALNMNSFADYYRLVTGGSAPQEFNRMIDLLTTHETYFFREPSHFDYLAGYCRQKGPSLSRVRIWSAACSSGEEAYSIGMLLMDKLGARVPWSVIGSDVSTDVLERAREAIYSTERIDGISLDYLRRFCLKGIGRKHGTLRIVPEICQRVEFMHVNLKAPPGDLGLFDIIFLRNVLIYFDPATKTQIVNLLHRHLAPSGVLIVGHSESLNGLTTMYRMEKPTIYRRISGSES